MAVPEGQLPVNQTPMEPAAVRLGHWAQRNPVPAVLAAIAVIALIASLAISIAFTLTADRNDGSSQATLNNTENELRKARDALHHTNRRLVESDRTRGRFLADQGDIDQGLLWFGRALEDLEHNPDMDAAIREEIAGWMQNHRPLLSIIPHTADVKFVVAHPNGQRFLTGTTDSVRVWDATGKPIGQPFKPRMEVMAAVFDPLRDSVIIGGSSLDDRMGQVMRFDIATGFALGEPFTLEKNTPVVALAWSPDGKQFAAGTMKLADLLGAQSLHVFDLATKKPVAAPAVTAGTFGSIAFSPDSKRVAALTTEKAFGPGELAIFTTHDLKPLGKPFRTGSTGPMVQAIGSVAFSTSGKSIREVSGGRVRTWDSEKGTLQDAVPHVSNGPADLLGGGNGFWAADGSAARWISLRTGRASGTPLRHAAAITSLAESTDGLRVFTASQDRSVRVWGTTKADTLPHAEPIRPRVGPPDGSWVAVPSDKGGISLLDVATRTSRKLPGFDEVARVLAVANDGRKLLLGTDDGKIAIFELNPDRMMFEGTGHVGAVLAGAFSPDGKQVATAGADGQLRRWNLATGSEIRPAFAHPDRVLAVAFTPDGKALLTSCDDSVTRRWQLERPGGSPAQVTRMLEKQTGLRLDADGTVRPLSFEEWNTR